MKSEAFLLMHATGSGAGSIGSLWALRESDAYLFVLPLCVFAVFVFLDVYMLWKVLKGKPARVVKRR